MNENKPIAFTYLIGWTQHNKWYYGVRYSKKSHPSSLWVTYFTSSSHVKNFRKENGEPDVIEIRKIFSSATIARKCEDRVLESIPRNLRENWLNQKFGMFGGFSDSPERIAKIKASWTDERKRSWSKYQKNLCEDPITRANKGRPGSQNGMYGRTHSDDIKLAQSIRATGNPARLGQPHLESSRAKQSEKAKNRVKYTCIHCSISCAGANYFRWHGDNCKYM